VMRVGERGFNLQRMLNLRDGIDRSQDRLPARLLEPSPEGSRAGKAPTGFDEALQEYYRLRGWDTEGRPTKETLTALDLPTEAS